MQCGWQTQLEQLVAQLQSDLRKMASEQETLVRSEQMLNVRIEELEKEVDVLRDEENALNTTIDEMRDKVWRQCERTREHRAYGCRSY